MSYWEKTVKTRKDHACIGCTEKIKKGSKAKSIKTVYDGQFGCGHLCKTCGEYQDKVCVKCESSFQCAEEWSVVGWIRDCKIDKGITK